MAQLVDYAWTKPSASQIVAGGFAGVLRYLSHDSGKNLSGGERDALLAAGLSIGLVWETTATRAGQGYAAGQQDVQAAEAQAGALGYPAGCPIFYAVDYDAAPAAVVPYFQGVQGLARWPVGVYGSANVIEGVPVPWKWQTIAWSHGRVSAQAHFYQTLLASLPGCDLNKVLRPVPLWSTGAGSSGGIASGTVHIPTAPTFPSTTPTKRRNHTMFYLANTGTYYLATDFNIQVIEPDYVSTATGQWGAPVNVTAEYITRLTDIVRANRLQSHASN